MIKLENVSKSFGRQTVLDTISLTFEKDKIYGLFGRNGVGKSTLLNLMATQIFPNTGSIAVENENPFAESSVREKICFIKESGFGINLKVKDIFKYAKGLYPNWDEGLKETLVTRFDIPLKKPYEKLSRGNKTLVGLITGLAARAPYTFFDEPTLGLDPANRYAFYEVLLEDYEKFPRTIVIATHLIDEVTNLFEEIIILKDNHVHTNENSVDLMQQYFTLEGSVESIEPFVGKYKVLDIETFGQRKIVHFKGPLLPEDQFLLKQYDVQMRDIPLQKLFVLLTEKETQHV